MRAATEERLTAEHLRMLRAAQQVPVYVLAARCQIHPGRLSMYLRGTLDMPPGVAERIVAGLLEERA